MIPAAFDYHAPSSVGQAMQLLAQHGDSAKILAGGHSLIPMMKLRLAQPSVLIDLGKVSGMSGITESGGALTIGAMTSYYAIASSDAVKRSAFVLAEAAAIVADPQVRNRGTIGGSLAHADPAADLPAVVVALGAQLVAQSSAGSRTIAADDFFVDLFTTALQPNEILTEIRFPALAQRTGAAYMKFANKASHYAVVGVAASVTVGANGSVSAARVGITGAGAKASRASATEAALVGKPLNGANIKAAAATAGQGIDFNSDAHASADYRAHLVTVYAERAIKAAAARV